VRVGNDPVTLAAQVASWGESPEVVLAATYAAGGVEDLPDLHRELGPPAADAAWAAGHATCRTRTATTRAPGRSPHALVALASPASAPPDRDLATYWSGFVGPDDPIAAAWWVRRSAAAFRDGTGVAVIWAETAPAAVRAAARADPAGYITTQGHVLADEPAEQLSIPVDGVCRPGWLGSFGG
jgi:hypothetical protein